MNKVKSADIDKRLDNWSNQLLIQHHERLRLASFASSGRLSELSSSWTFQYQEKDRSHHQNFGADPDRMGTHLHFRSGADDDNGGCYGGGFGDETAALLMEVVAEG